MGFEVFARESARLHHVMQEVYGIRIGYRMVLRLPSLDQQYQHFEAVGLFRCGGRIPQLFGLPERGLVVTPGFDGIGLRHRF